MKALTDPLPPLHPWQKRLLAVSAALVALSRLAALSRTLWDWDEAQFCMALREYDVPWHQPHPPGFPLYVLLAKIVSLAGVSDFHAYQVVNFVAAAALFPLLFLLARELRFPFATAWLGSLLFVFLPNVWFFGGTAFSDVCGLALVIAACAVLIRACREPRALLGGALLLALAAAVRPQALMLGMVPALAATWCRRREWKQVVAASVLGAAVIAVAYAGAALASQSVALYLETGDKLKVYLRDVDSFLAASRPPLRELAGTFFAHPTPGPAGPLLALAALAGLLAAAVRGRRLIWILVAIFLPFNVFGWLMLDYNSISRYAVGWAPLYALCAAEAAAAFALLARRRAVAVQSTLMMLATAYLVAWTWPALREVRNEPSPPYALMQWLRALPEKQTEVFVHRSLKPWSRYFLSGRRATIVDSAADLPSRPMTANDWYAVEDVSGVADARTFFRPQRRIVQIARQRYFEVVAIPASALAIFGDGWYFQERGAEIETWRWMSGRGSMLLPPVLGKARLTLAFELPKEVVPRRPVIEVRVNGLVVDRLSPSTVEVHAAWVVDARSDRWNEIVIASDKPLNPKREGLIDDPRDLGLRLNSWSWSSAVRP